MVDLSLFTAALEGGAFASAFVADLHQPHRAAFAGAIEPVARGMLDLAHADEQGRFCRLLPGGLTSVNQVPGYADLDPRHGQMLVALQPEVPGCGYINNSFAYSGMIGFLAAALMVDASGVRLVVIIRPLENPRYGDLIFREPMSLSEGYAALLIDVTGATSAKRYIPYFQEGAYVRSQFGFTTNQAGDSLSLVGNWTERDDRPSHIDLAAGFPCEEWLAQHLPELGALFTDVSTRPLYSTSRPPF